jgi:hypothetical protein
MGCLELGLLPLIKHLLVRCLELTIQVVQGIYLRLEPSRTQSRPRPVLRHNKGGWGAAFNAVHVDQRCDHVLCRAGRLDCAWVPNVVCPCSFELHECICPSIQKLLEGVHLSAHAHALHAEVHRLEVLCESSFTSQIWRKVGDHNRPSSDRVNKFKAEELP